MKQTKIYTPSDFIGLIDGLINFDKLDIEIKASPIKNYEKVVPIFENIHIFFTEDTTSEDETILDTIVANHDGKNAETSQEEIQRRTLAFNKLVQMAHYHPNLSNATTNAYLTSIDNWKNAFLTDGVKDNIISKIAGDKEAGSYTAYLNTTVLEITMPDNSIITVNTADYLISQIQEI